MIAAMKRLDKFTKFLTINYCQNCQLLWDERCDIEEISIKHNSHGLNFEQAREAKLFSLNEKKNKCINYMKQEGHPNLLHVVEIHYKNNKKEKLEWLSNDDIAELWINPDIENIDVIFSDF